MHKRWWPLGACTLAAVLAMGCGTKTATDDGRPWRAFVEDMTNLSRLASLDTTGTQLISSYDRKGGNDDYNNFAGASREAGWVVLADLKGPGCVRRYWTTGLDLGHEIRIYFDGEKQPRIHGKVQDVFGATYPLQPPLARYLNMCWWSYVPLTYRESIRIEMQAPNAHKIWGPRRLFYQLNVETYAPGTAVQTFPRKFDAADRAVVDRVAEAWSACVLPPAVTFENVSPVTIAPGAAGDVLTLEGPGILEAWDLRVEPVDPSAWTKRERAYLLQDVVLRVTYNGADAPSIDVPLGDFFLNGWRERHYGSLVLGVSSNAFRCALPAPFEQGLRMHLVNGCDRPVQASIRPRVAGDWSPDLGYLHADWRKSGPDAGKPHVISEFTGRGKYVGCFLGVTGLEKSWWILEGDEHMYVDGETAPSWHGTGLEDYFNGGWYYRGAAFSGLHGIMDRAPFRTAQYRFHLTDPVAFERTHFMDLERGDQNVSHGYMRSVAYAYLDAPAGAAPTPGPREDRRSIELPFQRETFMLQLVELERMNNYRKAIDYIAEYLETYPDAKEAGIYRLRTLEYRRLLGEEIGDTAYDPFLNGEHGEGAAAQARLLQWFHAGPDRAIIGMCSNGDGHAYVDGKEVLKGNHPYQLFVNGLILKEGSHALAASVTMMRNDAWLQLGVRTHDGFAGSGYGMHTSRTPPGDWRTGPVQEAQWGLIQRHNIFRGIPDAPYIGGIPNAFIFLQSKAYAVGMEDWSYYKGTAYYRTDFEVPLKGMPDFTYDMTGLTE